MVKNNRKMKHALKWEELFKLKKKQEYVAKHINKRCKFSDNGEELQQIKFVMDFGKLLIQIKVMLTKKWL